MLAAAGICAGSLGLYLEPVLLAARRSRGTDGPEADGGPEQPAAGFGCQPPFAALLPLVGVLSLRPAQSAKLAAGEEAIPVWLQALTLELLLGLVFALLGWRFGWRHHRTELILACLYSTLLFEMAVIDFHTRLILDVLSYPGMLIGLAGAGLWSGIGLGSSLLGGGIALLLFIIFELVSRGAMGRGDTKLATAIGLMRGYPALWGALLAGILVGGVIATGLLLSGRGRRSTFAYGPALAVGGVVSLFLGRI